MDFLILIQDQERKESEKTCGERNQKRKEGRKKISKKPIRLHNKEGMSMQGFSKCCMPFCGVHLCFKSTTIQKSVLGENLKVKVGFKWKRNKESPIFIRFVHQETQKGNKLENPMKLSQNFTILILVGTQR